MQHLDNESIQNDSSQRFQFLCDFIGFGQDDIGLIQSSAPILGPKVPALVDQTYEKLLEFNVTAVHFLPKNQGFDGAVPEDLAALTADHPQIQFRKDHLNRYLVSLFTRSFDNKMVMYLDMVGKIHTPDAGNKSIHVPLYQMNALMGLISDILTRTLMESTLDENRKIGTIRAYQKLLWIQNDFINRHYAK